MRLASVAAVERCLVVTNAEAGSAEEEAVAAAVTELRAAYEVEVLATADPDDLRDVLARRDGRLVVVVGGDGSLHATVAVLHGEGWLDDTVVALVPLGTGNDFARGLELPLDPAEAARAVVDGSERRFDLFVEDGGQVVVNAVHMGVGVDAADQATKLKGRWGRFGYVLGAARAGFVSKGQRLQVVLDDDMVADGRHHVLQVAVANGRFVGGGTPIAPTADPGDGNAEVVLSYALAPAKRFAYAVLVRLGRHDRRRDVETYQACRIEVSSQRPFRWNVDGEIEGPERRRAWSVHSGVLRFRAPG